MLHSGHSHSPRSISTPFRVFVGAPLTRCSPHSILYVLVTIISSVLHILITPSVLHFNVLITPLELLSRVIIWCSIICGCSLCSIGALGILLLMSFLLPSTPLVLLESTSVPNILSTPSSVLLTSSPAPIVQLLCNVTTIYVILHPVARCPPTELPRLYSTK